LTVVTWTIIFRCFFRCFSLWLWSQASENRSSPKRSDYRGPSSDPEVVLNNSHNSGAQNVSTSWGSVSTSWGSVIRL